MYYNLLPEEIWQPYEPLCAVNIVKETKENPSKSLNKATDGVEELGSGGPANAGKYGRKEQGGKADDAKDKPILQKENQECTQVVLWKEIDFFLPEMVLPPCSEPLWGKKLAAVTSAGPSQCKLRCVEFIYLLLSTIL